MRQIFGFLVALGVSSRAFGALPAALPHILIKHGDVQTKVDGEWKSTIATENLIPPHYRLAPVFASDLATGPSVDWDWFHVNPCTNPPYGNAILDGVNAMVDAGVPLIVEPIDCSTEDAHALFPADANNEKFRKVGENHVISVLASKSGPGWQGLKHAVRQWRPTWSDNDVEYHIENDMYGGIAVDRVLRTVHPSFPAQQPRQEYSWKIYINKLPGGPPATVLLPAEGGFDAAAGMVSIAEIVVHEMMHILGAGHITTLDDYPQDVFSLVADRPATVMSPRMNWNSRGGASATAGAVTMYYPSYEQGYVYLPSMDKQVIAEQYPWMYLYASTELVPWHPSLDLSLQAPAIEAYNPLVDAGEDITFEYCPSGFTPHGFEYVVTPSDVGRLMTGDFEAVDDRLPLVDVWPAGSSDASDFSLHYDDGSLAGYTNTWLWATWAPGVGGESRLKFEVTRTGLGFTYLRNLEPPCYGCQRFKAPLRLVPAADPEKDLEVGLWMAKPHACGRRCEGGEIGGVPCYRVIDQATFPCCDPDPELLEE